MKKTLAALLILTLVLSLSACGAKPETAVDQYFTAAKAFDTEGMKAVIDPANEESVAATADLTKDKEDGYSEYFQNYLKENAAKITYTISNSEISGDTAKITVDCRYVDGGPILNATITEALQKIIGKAFRGEEFTKEETNQMFLDIMKTQTATLGETYKETSVEIICIKKDRKWYIAKVDQALLDVVTSGFVSAASGLGPGIQ